MDMLATAKLLSCDARVKILFALMSGEALPASELAYRANVSNQTASEHLKKLEIAGVIKSRKCGRHRYYELGSTEVAVALEQFSISELSVLPKKTCAVPENLRYARFCYDHLAGWLGVEITNALISQDALKISGVDYSIVSEFHPIFVNLGINISVTRKKRRRFANQCIDWSERRPHVAGALGAVLAERFLELQWIVRSRDDRSASISEPGREGLSQIFGIAI